MTADLVSPSASYAAEVTRLLWPEPWQAPRMTRSRQGPATGQRDVYMFPSGGNARLLVPADLPGSSIMIRRLGGSRSGLAAPARLVLERSVRSRAFPLLGWPRLRVEGDDPGADSIERHLSSSLGTDVRVGILLGTRRVNQKPVLQVFDAGGTVLGYAKIGHNPLTADLVRREASALARINARHPRAFRAPRVLHHDCWAGLEVLVISPLLGGTGPRVRPAPRRVAAQEITELDGTVTATVGDSTFFTRLVERAFQLSESDGGDSLLDAIEVLADRHGDGTLVWGGWHGDWGRWNMSLFHGTLQVWDWERYEADVPVGFDELHYAAQSVRPELRAGRQQEQAFLACVDQLLAGMRVPAEQRSLTVLLYLSEMAARYLEGLSHGSTPVLRQRTSWVLSLLERQLRHSHLGSNGGS